MNYNFDCMASSRTNSKATKATPAPGGNSSNTRLWSHVARANIDIVSCHSSNRETGNKDPLPPDLDTTIDEEGYVVDDSPSRSSAASKYASRTDDLFSKILTPYIVGSARNSTLIEITKLSNFEQLKKFFASFNQGDEYLFYGALPQEKKYFQRTFIETCWDQDSSIYKELITTGLKLDDHHTIKGYPSLDSEAKIARVTATHLPIWYHPKMLREKMEERFTSFGTVLDVGFQFDCGTFMGKGYVVLDRNTTNPATLEHEINWDIDDGSDDWKVYMHWKDMPHYCRYCQKPDHCRADCPELLATKQCHNCNEPGHIARHCHRNNVRTDQPGDKKMKTNQFKTRKSGSTRASTTVSNNNEKNSESSKSSTMDFQHDKPEELSTMIPAAATTSNIDNEMDLDVNKKINNNLREERDTNEREYKKHKASDEDDTTERNTINDTDNFTGSGGSELTIPTPTPNYL